MGKHRSYESSMLDKLSTRYVKLVKETMREAFKELPKDKREGIIKEIDIIEQYRLILLKSV